MSGGPVYVGILLEMDHLAYFCNKDSSITSEQKRRLFIRQYCLQNYVNDANERNFSRSGLWMVTDPRVAEGWSNCIGDKESSKS